MVAHRQGQQQTEAVALKLGLGPEPWSARREQERERVREPGLELTLEPGQGLALEQEQRPEPRRVEERRVQCWWLMPVALRSPGLPMLRGRCPGWVQRPVQGPLRVVRQLRCSGATALARPPQLG